MRRLPLSLAVATLLATGLARPAAAEGLKEYLDCMSFVDKWCDETRKTVQNPLEYMAVEAGCAALYLSCTAKVF